VTLDEVMAELESLGSEQIRKIYANHGNTGNIFGVKIGDTKPLQKKLKNNQAMALALYETGNYDAMYLAGLIADGSKMTVDELDSWARSSTFGGISENTVAWVAAESPFARDLALKWIDSPDELVASSGWKTYIGVLALRPDEQIDNAEVETLLQRIESSIHQSQNRVRSCMNSFIIAVGSYIPAMNERAKESAKRIGPVNIDVGNTSCKVPFAVEYIEKVEAAGKLGQKRKTMKC
jgi:3-methyladenine DNA glycosylase AlkD